MSLRASWLLVLLVGCAGGSKHAPTPAPKQAPVAGMPPAESGDTGESPICEPTSPCLAANQAYIQTPTPNRPMGYYSTGVLLLDLDRDDNGELVLTNGNDVSPQQLTVMSPNAERYPHWYSQESLFYGRPVAGDIDKDGYLDLASAYYFPLDLQMASGGAIVHFGTQTQGSAGQPRPPLTFKSGWRTPRDSGYGAQSVDLADMDGDGDLDLVVGGLQTGGTWNGLHDQPETYHLLIYENVDGKLGDAPVWTSEEESYYGAVRAADVDLDGFMDVVSAGTEVQLHRGGRAADGSIQVETKASWTSDALNATTSLGMDVALVVPTAKALSVAVFPTCYQEGGCTGVAPIPVFQPGGSSTAPVWSVDGDADSGAVAWADVNGDGVQDLAVSRFYAVQALASSCTSKLGTTPSVENTLTLYTGQSDGSLCTCAAYTASPVLAGLDIAVGCLKCGGDRYVPETYTTTLSDAPGPVITLPMAPLDSVTKVEVDGEDRTADATFRPRAPFVSIPDLPAGAEVEITYTYVRHPDLALADFRPQCGSAVFTNYLVPSASDGN